MLLLMLIVEVGAVINAVAVAIVVAVVVVVNVVVNVVINVVGAHCCCWCNSTSSTGLNATSLCEAQVSGFV